MPILHAFQIENSELPDDGIELFLPNLPGTTEKRILAGQDATEFEFNLVQAKDARHMFDHRRSLRSFFQTYGLNYAHGKLLLDTLELNYSASVHKQRV